MFHEGDYVMYSGMGLCTVEKIGTPDFQPKGSQYYFLRQADDRSRIYVPVDTSMPMRKPITGPEAERLLEALSAEVIKVKTKPGEQLLGETTEFQYERIQLEGVTLEECMAFFSQE